MAWKYKLLVVANVTGSSPELIQALKARAARDTCGLTLLIPATGGGTGGREAATKRLQDALDRMRAEGLEVEGRVGDPDPVAAVTDIWDPAEFDEVIVSTLPRHVSKWLHLDLPHKVAHATGLPTEHVSAHEAKAAV